MRTKLCYCNRNRCLNFFLEIIHCLRLYKFFLNENRLQNRIGCIREQIFEVKQYINV